MEVCTSYMMGDESKNMDNSVGEDYRERSEIKVMNDYYCITIDFFNLRFFSGLS